MDAAKDSLRKLMRRKLKSMDAEAIAKQSKCVVDLITDTKIYKSAVSVCMFLSMPNVELDTQLLVTRACQDGNQTYTFFQK